MKFKRAMVLQKQITHSSFFWRKLDENKTFKEDVGFNIGCYIVIIICFIIGIGC